MSKEDSRELLQELQLLVKDNNQISAANAKELLEQKYGKSFDVVKIGNRLDRDTVSLQMVTQEEPKVYFTVTLNNETMSFHDDLIKRSVGKRLSEEMTEKLAEKNISSAGVIRILSDDDSVESNAEIESKEFFERYHASGILIYMAIHSETFSAVENDVRKVCSEMSEQYQVTVAVSVYCFTDHYEICVQDLSKRSEANDSWFESYQPREEQNLSFVYEQKK